MTNKKVFIPSQMKKKTNKNKKKNATWNARLYHVNVDFVLTSFPSIQQQHDKISAYTFSFSFFLSFFHSFSSLFFLLFICHFIWSFAVVVCWFTFKLFYDNFHTFSMCSLFLLYQSSCTSYYSSPWVQTMCIYYTIDAP